MTTPHARRRHADRGAHDRGAAALGLIVGVVLCAFALLAFVLVPLVTSTGMAGRSSSAADAAALAAAQRVREAALDAALVVPVGGTVGGTMAPSVGITDAQTYARRNGSELVGARYHADLRADRVRVEVRTPDPEGLRGGTYRQAEAEVGVALDRCELTRERVIVGYEPPPPPPEPTPEPEPDPSATPTPSPTPPPPPPPVPVFGWDHTFTCTSGGGAVLVSLGPERDVAVVRTAMRAWLDARLEPRLVR
ncbi:hypothetical protein J1G43_07150 [Cellulomonas sp. zg-ZUI22]|uniref:hypothetical protein n=1 Tax=Cellulomonas sp. zg-ZUI22 TaxID=2816955 RepID=UPI001A93B2F7|nr:hypothetical protein [Cellulomonas sp. zg-ZUI22]MBO0899739.1 hypothetical protein [Cellulomonas sp. zg-ZUI22]